MGIKRGVKSYIIITLPHLNLMKNWNSCIYEEFSKLFKNIPQNISLNMRWVMLKEEDNDVIIAPKWSLSPLPCLGSLWKAFPSSSWASALLAVMSPHPWLLLSPWSACLVRYLCHCLYKLCCNRVTRRSYMTLQRHSSRAPCVVLACAVLCG